MTVHQPTTRGPLILLHGLGRTRWSLWPVARAAVRREYTVCSIGYPSRHAPVEQLAEFVAAEIDRAMPGERFSVVTHSLGGIVLRAAVAAGLLAAGRVHRAVMLAPPNRGSELAELLRRNPVYRLATGPAGQQIGMGPESLPRSLPPPPFELGVIAGDRSLNPFFSRAFSDASDGKVSVASATIEGMRDMVVVPRSHTFIMWAPEVLAQVFEFLERGRFAPTRSTPTGSAPWRR